MPASRRFADKTKLTGFAENKLQKTTDFHKNGKNVTAMWKSLRPENFRLDKKTNGSLINRHLSINLYS